MTVSTSAPRLALRIDRLLLSAGADRRRRDVGAGEGENRKRKHERRRSVTESDSADVGRLADVVSEGRPEWARDDISHPECGNSIQIEPPPRQSRQQDNDREQDAGPEVAEIERCGWEVP